MKIKFYLSELIIKKGKKSNINHIFNYFNISLGKDANNLKI